MDGLGLWFFQWITANLCTYMHMSTFTLLKCSRLLKIFVCYGLFPFYPSTAVDTNNCFFNWFLLYQREADDSRWTLLLAGESSGLAEPYLSALILPYFNFQKLLLKNKSVHIEWSHLSACPPVPNVLRWALFTDTLLLSVHVIPRYSGLQILPLHLLSCWSSLAFCSYCVIVRPGSV